MGQTFKHVIPKNSNAPERLRGLEVTLTLIGSRMQFEIEMPDEPTPNELGYFKWFTGEMVEKVCKKLGISYSSGEVTRGGCSPCE